jgi:hypothetical protein
VPEDLNNLGQLGNQDETLLSTAINEIINSGRILPNNTNVIETSFFKDAKDLRPFGKEMYISF